MHDIITAVGGRDDGVMQSVVDKIEIVEDGDIITSKVVTLQ